MREDTALYTIILTSCGYVTPSYGLLNVHINHRRVHYLPYFTDEKAPPLQCKVRSSNSISCDLCSKSLCERYFLTGLFSFSAVDQYCNPTFESLSVYSIIFPCFCLIPVRIFSLCTFPLSSSSYFAYFIYTFQGKRFHKRFAQSSSTLKLQDNGIS